MIRLGRLLRRGADRILRQDPEPEPGDWPGDGWTGLDFPDPDGFWVDMGYTPQNPCPYPSCHHNQPGPGEAPAIRSPKPERRQPS